MNVSLTPDLQRFVDEKVATGGYSSPEDVVRAALASLQQAEKFGDFQPGELDSLIREGEKSLEYGGPIAADQVFADLRRKSNGRRSGDR
jgi:antitoxin ParD1/3/4